MAEFNVILALEDKVEFATWLSKEYAAKFVIDDDRPEISEVRNVDAIRSILTQDFPPLVFVLSAHWSSHPLYKSRVMNQYRGEIHYIMQRYGGPAFMWMPGNILRKSDGMTLTVGLFSDYPTYYESPDTGAIVRRPPGMTAAFRASQKFLRKLSKGRRTKWEWGKVGPWISDRAWRQVTDGSATIRALEVPIDAD